MSGSCRSVECEVDASISSGLNVYPYKNQVVHWNTEFLYLNRSPVGGFSLPYPVGGDGCVFHSNFLLDL